ncbi:MAG: alpha-L-fucosidase [Candidatus Aminicenantales bacterium]
MKSPRRKTASLAFLAILLGALAARPAQQPAPVTIGPGDSLKEIVRKAAGVVPSPRQIAWQEIEFAGFIHFGMNTFTNREWGEGKEDPKLFNPTDFDARQWVAAFKAAGMKMLILTAKHHDGFCLWPSRYTEHSVKNSPWRGGKGDVVREVADACREAGLKLGIYLSPWDRHEPTYGDSPAYNEHFKNQLRELLTNYGDVADFWFDGACGEGPNGKRQVYDWPGYWAVIRELQPRATISIMGPDARWCGNEAGVTRESEWSVVPLLKPIEEAVSDSAGGIDYQKKDLGSRQALLEAAKKGARLAWYPAQVDTSIRPGWFYHAAEDDKVKSLAHLLDIYYGAIGGNSTLLLNVPPDPRGRLHDNDVRRLKQIGDALRTTFADNLAKGAKATATQTKSRGAFGAAHITDADGDSYWTTDDGVTAAAIEFDLGSAKIFNVAMLQEQIKVGQRIEELYLDAWTGSVWKEIARSTTVGFKRLLRFPEVAAAKVRVRITQSRVCPTLSNFGLFRASDVSN